MRGAGSSARGSSSQSLTRRRARDAGAGAARNGATGEDGRVWVPPSDPNPRAMRKLARGDPGDGIGRDCVFVLPRDAVRCGLGRTDAVGAERVSSVASTKRLDAVAVSAGGGMPLSPIESDQGGNDDDFEMGLDLSPSEP